MDTSRSCLFVMWKAPVGRVTHDRRPIPQHPYREAGVSTLPEWGEAEDSPIRNDLNTKEQHLLTPPFDSPCTTYAETNADVFTPLGLDLNAAASVKSALAELVKRGRSIDFLLLNAGLVPGKGRVITAAGIEASPAPLIGHHQLAVGLLRANLLSPDARTAIAGSEPARGAYPCSSTPTCQSSRPNTTAVTASPLWKP